MEALNHRLGVLGRAFAEDDAQDQAVLGVEGYVLPALPLVLIRWIGALAVFLLLGDERPLLIELDLLGFRGKRPRARRGFLRRARPLADLSGSRYRDGRPRVARSCARRTPRLDAPRPKPLSPGADVPGRRGYPCVRKTDPYRHCSKGDGIAFVYRSDRRPRDFPLPGGRAWGRRDSGSRTGIDRQRLWNLLDSLRQFGVTRGKVNALASSLQ